MMTKVLFIGRVLPEPVKISMQSPDLNWNDIGATFRVKIGNSIVNVECEIKEYDPKSIDDLYRRALDLARASVNLVAFANGYGVTVILDTFLPPDGMPSPILQTDQSLPPLCTSFSLDPARQSDFNAVLNTVLTEPPLFSALNDLIGAITLPHVSLVNCARAIESLKHLIAQPDAKDPQAWEQMRDALQIGEPYLKYITDQSKNARHGRPGYTPGSITTEVTRRSWMIMNRYFEYRKRGAQPLPVNEFPLLNNHGQSAANGRKVSRWKGHGPCSAIAARWAFVA